jgi:hypothetical protein
LFTAARMADFAAGTWVSTELVANPVLEHLHQLRQFTGIVRVTFRANVTTV